jgi:hypothetical protein
MTEGAPERKPSSTFQEEVHDLEDGAAKEWFDSKLPADQDSLKSRYQREWINLRSLKFKDFLEREKRREDKKQ